MQQQQRSAWACVQGSCKVVTCTSVLGACSTGWALTLRLLLSRTCSSMMAQELELLVTVMGSCGKIGVTNMLLCGAVLSS